MSKTLECMILISREVWEADNAGELQALGAMMCAAHLEPPSPENMAEFTRTESEEGKPDIWHACEMNDGSPMYQFANSIPNMMGPNGNVLIPMLMAEAQAIITRHDTRFKIGTGTQEWFKFMGVKQETPPEPEDV